jgi:hypothetical protein
MGKKNQVQKTYNDVGWLSYLGNNDVKKVDIIKILKNQNIIMIIFTMTFVMICLKVRKIPKAIHWNITKQKVWSH